MQKATSIESLHLVGEFETLKQQILADEQKFEALKNKTLAFWALPTDRRLPLALLGHSLGEILNTPFVEIASTPGIGRKKLAGLILLLRRAASTDVSELPAEGRDGGGLVAGKELEIEAEATDIDFDTVSEVTWAKWQATVVRLGLEKVPLGRVAPSLRNITRVIWEVPLGEFTTCTLDQLRKRRTYGAKRVRAVLEVFYFLHRMLENVPSQSHLAMILVPNRIRRVEEWVVTTWQSGRIPQPQEALEHFIKPLLEQINIDAGRQLVMLAEARLGIGGNVTSVRQLARSNGLTRARVYQLFNEMADIVRVRWPMGQAYMFLWRAILLARTTQLVAPPDLTQFFAAIDLFFANRRPAGGSPVQHNPLGEFNVMPQAGTEQKSVYDLGPLSMEEASESHEGIEAEVSVSLGDRI
ncbi:MAG: hypothetical protein D6741_07575 [Planctomycetota bacterium]|nr:MAG: hypothetical protein D6741_07575 [Planctomycetota bacterium]